MKFEEVLPLMREGKRAQCPSYSGYHYWIISKIGIDGFEPKNITLSCVNGITGTVRNDYNSWGIPRVAIMSDDWEIVE